MPASSSLRIKRIAALRDAVRAIEIARRKGSHACLPFGLDAIDARLEGGGLAMAALHEASGIASSPGDEAASCLFAAGIAARGIRRERGAILWALKQRDLFAPALAQAGLSPSRLLYAECGCDEDVLAVMEEGLRHGGLAAVVGEVGKAPMAATRRLQLAAEEGGTMALLLKRWRRSQEDPLGLPSAAVTRWRIGCLPSERLQVPGVGRARWQLVLARQRGGEPFEWIVEGTDAEGRLALPAHSPHRPLAADVGERRAA